MRNKTLIVIAALCALLLVVSSVMVALQYSAAPDDEIEIIHDGKTIYRGKAVHAGKEERIEVKGPNYTNCVVIDANGVKVESADCPNGECVKMGYLKSRYLPIVCLPNDLVIRYVGDDGQDIDGVSQ